MTSSNFIREASQPRTYITIGALSYPNLSAGDHFQALAVIWQAMRFNQWNSAKIVDYLAGCGCPFDLGTVQFMLDAYTGVDPQSCLWSRDQAGRYTALEIPEEAPIKRRRR